MTNYEKIKSMSVEEFVNFIDTYGARDYTPWVEWWEKNYCDNCESVTISNEKQQEVLGFTSFRAELECSYCEVHDKCKFFSDKKEISHRDIITLWLEEEYKDEKI